MLEEILNPETWVPQPIAEQLKNVDERNQRAGAEKQPQGWYNPDRLLSQLAVYSFLKIRIGPPNGFIMFTKTRTADNLIHWHYALTSHGASIHVMGKTSGLEIMISLERAGTLTTDDWQLLVANFNASFQKHSKAIKDIRSQFEHWSVFINPFVRVENTLQYYINQLAKLNLTEPRPPEVRTKEAVAIYLKELTQWTTKITKATALSTTIRMLCPVMAEAFINLVILVFCKEEFREDQRLYENFLRQQIDIRVKTLHMYCDCFASAVDSTTNAFKKFHTLMNKRNDILHGNVDPYKLVVEDVWFDQTFIPLFDNDEGLIKRMMRNYSKNAEPQQALDDFQGVSDFIELILMTMDDRSLYLFSHIMQDKMPGINKKNKRLGNLFPVTHYAEIFPSF